MDSGYEVVPKEQLELARQDVSNVLLSQIRPAWKARSLIERVKNLIPVDLSSACQRLLNAAIHDLREKVLTAGIDIAQQIAKENKLPPIEKPEDIEEYSTSRLIDLCYRMGILSRGDWRKLQRAYDIRRDLEHEDDQYQAGLEDCVYIFTTCVQIVLSQDPIQLMRVTDVKEVVEEPVPFVPSSQLLDDYQHAPAIRQEEIGRFLISVALDREQPDIVRRNCVEFMRHIEPLTTRQVKIELASELGKRIGRKLDEVHAKVAYAYGVLPYLKQRVIQDFFVALLKQMDQIGYQWQSHSEHTAVLEILEDVGGLKVCPPKCLGSYVKWLILAYVGEPGYGRSSRAVFYSNTASPIIHRLFERAPKDVFVIARGLVNDKDIKYAINQGKPVAGRYENLLDMEPEKNDMETNSDTS